MRPINNANADIVNDVSLPLFKIPILRIEELFTLYSEEPYNIKAKISKRSKRLDFEQVLRIRKWIPSDKSYGWYVYSEERDLKNPHLILRHVLWDKPKDKFKLKFNDLSKPENEHLNYCWPSIISKTYFLDKKNSKIISKKIKQFDSEQNKYFEISECDEKEKYYDIEFSRRYCWGEKKLIWNSLVESKLLENYILELENLFDCISSEDHENIYQLDFDYLYDVESMEKSIWGVDISKK